MSMAHIRQHLVDGVVPNERFAHEEDQVRRVQVHLVKGLGFGVKGQGSRVSGRPYIYVCINVYIHICIHMHIYICTYIRIYIYTYR